MDTSVDTGKSSTLKALLDRVKAFGSELQHLGLSRMLADAEPTKRRKFTADAVLIHEALSQVKRDFGADWLRLNPADRAQVQNAVARQERMFGDDSAITHKLTKQEQKLLAVYRKHRNAEGLDWCRALDAAKVHPREGWREDFKCKTYLELYDISQARTRIYDEKSKLVKKLDSLTS
jgi:hypothetical protein